MENFPWLTVLMVLPLAGALVIAALPAALADKAAFIGSAGEQVDQVVAAVNELVSAYPDAAKYTPGAIL